MELLTSSNRGGPLKCLKAKVNVDRLCGTPVALVAASISAFVMTGCVSLDAPNPMSPASVVDLEQPPISPVESSDSQVTHLESSGSLVANQALSIADIGD